VILSVLAWHYHTTVWVATMSFAEVGRATTPSFLRNVLRRSTHTDCYYGESCLLYEG
jgi:hypothetical protein